MSKTSSTIQDDVPGGTFSVHMFEDGIYIVIHGDKYNSVCGSTNEQMTQFTMLKKIQFFNFIGRLDTTI